MFNVGNSIEDYGAVVYVHYPNGTLAGNLSFANSTLIGGESQTMSGDWSSDGLPAGDYVASANVTYGVFTKASNLSFTITAQEEELAQAPDSSSHTVGGSRAAPFRKIEEIPAVSFIPSGPEGPNAGPERPNIRLIQYHVFKELLAGDTSFEFATLENLGSSSVLADILPTGPAAFLSSDTLNSLLLPGEPNSVAVPFNVPKDAKPGYYLLELSIGSGDSAFRQPMVVRVLSASKDPSQPAIKRSIELMRGENPKTKVVLTIENKGEEPIEFLQVYDQLPAGLIQTPGAVQYSMSPSVVSPEQQLVRWDLQNLAPHEKRTVAYEIPSLLTDLKAYSEWRVTQVVVSDTGASGRPGSQILLRDLKLPNMAPGAEGWLQLQLFNAGASNQSVDVSLVPPPGWTITPPKLSADLPPRSSTWMKFLVTSPISAESGAHAFSLRLDYGGNFDEHPLSLLTLSAMAVPPAAPLASQLAKWVSKNALMLELGFGALVLVILGAYFVQRRLSAPRYDKERVEDIKQLERMFKRSK